MASPFMDHFARCIAAHGWHVCRFNFPYVDAGRRTPDRAPVLEETFRAVVALVAAEAPAVIGGKSLGGRMAAHVAGDVGARGVFFLGYPLHPPGRPDRMRDEVLLKMRAPMLFVQGTRDPFCPLDTLRSVLRPCPAPHHLIEIDDGDHSFKVRRSSGRTTENAWDEAAAGVVAWAAALPPAA